MRASRSLRAPRPTWTARGPHTPPSAHASQSHTRRQTPTSCSTHELTRGLAAARRLDGVVTLIDAKHIEQHLDEEKPEGAENEAIEQARNRT